MSLNASAADVNIQLDSLSVRGLIGDTLTGYYVDSDRNYKSCEFSFNSYQTMNTGQLYFTPQGSYSSGSQIVLLYTTPLPTDIGQDLTQQDAIINVDVGLHLQNVRHFEMIFGGGLDGYFITTSYAALNTNNYILSTAPALPARSITAGDQFRTSLSYNRYDSSKGGFYGLNGAGGYSALYYSMDTSTAGDLYIDTVQCSCIALGSQLHFVMTLPYVNSDVVIPADPLPPFSGDGASSGTVSGTISDGSTTQDIHVTVETDNTGLIGGILSGIKNLFVPSDDYLNSWHEDLQDSFDEHLGGISDAVSLIDEQADYLRSATSAEYIYFPELTLPIGSTGYTDGVETIGADYTLIEGRQVELRPARDGNLKILWDFLEFAIDAVCVIAVFNMLQTKYEIFLNPDGEVISYDN